MSMRARSRSSICQAVLQESANTGGFSRSWPKRAAKRASECDFSRCRQSMPRRPRPFLGLRLWLWYLNSYSFSDIRVGSILLFTASRNEMCDVGYGRAARALVGAIVEVVGVTLG